MVARYEINMPLDSVSSAFTNPGSRLKANVTPAYTQTWNRNQSMGNPSTERGLVQWQA